MSYSKDSFRLFSLDEDNPSKSNTGFSVNSGDAESSENAVGTRDNKTSGALNSLIKRMHADIPNGPCEPEDENGGSTAEKTLPEDNSAGTSPATAGVKTDEASATVSKENLKTGKSLLEKLMPYIVDEEGRSAAESSPSLYELESVADILKSDSEKAIEKLSEKYNIFFDDLSSRQEPGIPSADTAASAEARDPLPEETPSQKTVKKDSGIPLISDIDIPNSPFYKIDAKDEDYQSTITFTPIAGEDSNKPEVVISTHTQPIDFTGELIKVDEPADFDAGEVQLEKSEFEEYEPQKEFSSPSESRLFLKQFARRKKHMFFVMFISAAMTLLTAFFELPFMSGTILSHTRTCMIISSVFTLCNIAANITVFRKLLRLFSRKADYDTCLSLAVLAVVLYSVFGIIDGSIILNMQLLLNIILAFRAAGRFMDISSLLKSFKQINKPINKHAVTLINDQAIAFAMTKGAVEGDSLIAAGRSAGHIDGFMKYSTFGRFLGGKIGIIAPVSLLISVISGFLAATYYSGPVHGFYAAAAVQCMVSLPVLFLIDALPLYSSSKKLASYGAMIAGKTGAEQLEQANALVMEAKDLFPKGTVILHQMKVLSENNLEDTIVRAASLTAALNSPLAPIFQKIAGTGNIDALPDSDTVKYEENLGISGWVDNRLLFIGNRTLMEAHGISVPSVEVDRKILRNGYFPVYVASQNKACALLMVQYNVSPDIAREMRRLTGIGVTVLVKSSDPNLTEKMICDYLGLYEDSVKVMTAAGCHIYVNTVTPSKSCTAPAAYKTNPLGLPAIINCANRIKRSNIILSACYFITCVLGILMFTYVSFGGSGSLLSDTALIFYSAASAIVSFLLYLVQKP